MSNISINYSVDDTLLLIENDIQNISEILNNIYNAVLTLDESKWNTKERKKLDEEFLPYLKKLSEKYPIYLNKRLDFTKDAVRKYKEINILQNKEVEDLEIL